MLLKEKPQTESRSKSIALPKGIVSHEKESSPQERLIEIIDRFERGWTAEGRSTRDQRHWGDCNMAPDIFSFVALDEGKRRGFEVMPRIYQLKDLHATAGGSRDDAFQHGFNTITIGDSSYLVDLTFPQFLGDNGKLQWGPKDKGYERYSSGIPNDNPLAQELVTQGFVPLTDENLQEYLRITSYAEDRTYVRNMKVELLSEITPRPIEIIESDGIGSDYGLE